MSTALLLSMLLLSQPSDVADVAKEVVDHVAHEERPAPSARLLPETERTGVEIVAHPGMTWGAAAGAAPREGRGNDGDVEACARRRG